MSARPTATLEATLDQLRLRWGQQIITRACERALAPTIPSGFPTLDELLGGGFPVGQINLLAGMGTCGAGTLAGHLAAHAQAERRPVVWLDGDGTFDAAHAVHAGVQLGDLFLIQPADLTQALALARDLAELLPGGLVVLVPPATSSRDVSQTAQELRRMAGPLARAGGTLLLAGAQSGLSEATGLALQLARRRWLSRQGVVCGCETVVTLRKGRGITSGRFVTLEIIYPEAL